MIEFPPVAGRRVTAAFDRGAISSDAEALLPGSADRAIRLGAQFTACRSDGRNAELAEHRVSTLLMQRMVGIALGDEDLIDHGELRRDPVMAVLAAKSTLNGLELSRPGPTRYHKVSCDPAAVESRLVRIFLEADQIPPAQIILDLEATDDPLPGQRGEQERGPRPRKPAQPVLLPLS